MDCQAAIITCLSEFSDVQAKLERGRHSRTEIMGLESAYSVERGAGPLGENCQKLLIIVRRQRRPAILLEDQALMNEAKQER